MHMDVAFFVEVRRNPQCFGTAAHHAPSCGNRLLHHIAQFAGADDVALAFKLAGFYSEQFAAHFRPRQAGYLADTIFAFGHAEIEAAHAQIIVQIVAVYLNHAGFGGFIGGCGLIGLQGLLHHHFAANFGDFPIQRAHTGFAGVIADNAAHRAFINGDLAFFNPVLLDLLGHQILQGDVDFFVFGIARQTDNLHAIHQRRRNVQAIGSGDKHHVRQIVFHFGIMVDKSMVLLRIQHFQQGAGRVATEVAPHFVDFIQQKQRIAHTYFGDVLQNFAGHRADISTAVAADFAFIVHAAQGHAHIFASGGFGNRLTQ